ncbi:histidine phosphatase superfamily [Gorgonomyces haynaldii]|nr:histidine phosphatase superfamily [Gorgonomyces haynaldii]
MESETHPTMSKLACVMVGLPARGKTYIARKVARYLTWLGHRSRIFNVGNYRRNAVGASLDNAFFDPENEEFNLKRAELANEALDDMLTWLESSGEDGSKQGSVDLARSASALVIDTKTKTTPTPTSGAGVAQPSCVALYDATNSTVDRRALIEQRCREKGIKVMFVESICDDEELVMQNIREVKISSPDYKGWEAEKAIHDFKARIAQYAKQYETLSTGELGGKIAFVKLSNVGEQVLVHNVRGYLQSRIVYFLMNLNITPRSFYISRHGESVFNLSQRIGGDSPLSERGTAFATRLPDTIKNSLPPGNSLTVWTSTLKRTIQTAERLPYQKLQWKQLDELDSGVCDGMTYEEIEEKYPLDFLERDTDKFNYRYHGGESYRDLVHRLEPVILELERHHEPNHSIYIVGHQAVVRAIYAYFHNIPHEELPYIKIPLHTIIKLTPKAYFCQEEQIKVDVPAVDTFRGKSDKSKIASPKGVSLEFAPKTK